MEYMACGKPVIAAFNSGHTDILTDVNSLPLREQKQYLMHENGELVADWSESSIDEILAKLEWAYHHRDEIKKTGANAGKYMQNFTWERTADSLLSDLQELGYI
jgi:glycosyltransferase involved in cell wall biosynthesis